MSTRCSTIAQSAIWTLAIQWLWNCNNECPNRGTGGTTPAMKMAQVA